MTDSIDAFLARYPAPMQEVARALILLTRSAMPKAHEVLYATQNHIGYGTSQAMRDRIVYICPMGEYVRLGFMWGGMLPDPQGLLAGEGKRLRHIKVRTLAQARQPAVKRLLREAWRHAGAARS